MHGLNPDMDLATFAQCAQAQKPLIETDQTKSAGLGSMTGERWEALAAQMRDLGVLDQPVKASECFANP
jgi:NitT/TauT family transport system substrate-binding protein